MCRCRRLSLLKHQLRVDSHVPGLRLQIASAQTHAETTVFLNSHRILYLCNKLITTQCQRLRCAASTACNTECEKYSKLLSPVYM